MPSSEHRERSARSVALEQAYVHDVYERFHHQDDDAGRNRTWPKVEAFLRDLEPGSLVCDVGCGNGKYLNVNTNLFNVGGERSVRLGDVAREKENEVVLLDNLRLPFRDESLDAVLSIAVVHHFATTERRVSALRELARVLRIGGRIVVSVWAMEQSHRKFESQDVLVPWRRPRHPPSLELNTSTTTTTNSEDDQCGQYAYHAYTQTSEDSDSNASTSGRSGSATTRRGRRGRNRGRGRGAAGVATATTTTSPSSSSSSPSSLSSPSNETCYSFVRRAIRRLHRRPWFLDGWSACAKESNIRKRYDPEGCECCACAMPDVQDLPIELRRIDDDEAASAAAAETASASSQASRRRQTLPSSQLINEIAASLKSKSMTNIRTSSGEEEDEEEEVGEDVKKEGSRDNLIEGGSGSGSGRSSLGRPKPKLVKQKRSICGDEDADDEALDQPTDMSTSTRNVSGARMSLSRVPKQRSLNEELIHSTSRRLKERDRVRGDIRKQASLDEEALIRRRRRRDAVSSTASLFYASTSRRLRLIRTGLSERSRGIIVRMLRSWKGGSDASPTTPKEESSEDSSGGGTKDASAAAGGGLQSDTSVDSSEDSFASVIFVPTKSPTSPRPAQHHHHHPHQQHHLPGSEPTSPRPQQQRQPSGGPTSPRPLQRTRTGAASAPNSPRSHVKRDEDAHDPDEPPPARKKSLDSSSSSPGMRPKLDEEDEEKDLLQKWYLTPSLTVPKCLGNHDQGGSPPPPPPPPPPLPPPSPPPGRDDNPKRFAELKKKKKRHPPDRYPMVRLVSEGPDGAVETPLTKPLPQLLHLELFDPETDDKDSSRDSSCVPSPENANSAQATSPRFKFPETGPRFRFPEIETSRFDEADVAEFRGFLPASFSLDRPPKYGRTRKRFGSQAGPGRPPWDSDEDKEVRRRQRHLLTDFASKLSERLLREIENDSNASRSINSYINRLSEELKRQDEYLERLDVGAASRLEEPEEPEKVEEPTPMGSCESVRPSSSASPSTTLSTASLHSLVGAPGVNNPPAGRPTKGRARRPPSLPSPSSGSVPSSPAGGGGGGGERTYHRYYHVFREGELDRLIEKYCNDLHVIATYYDHASWCVVAEKVRVWTI